MIMPVSPILAPAAVLVLWSIFMLFWVAFTRFPAVAKLPKETLRTLPKVGVRGVDADKVLPARVAWKSHNFAHLMEQPTIFYATVVILALAGQGAGVNVALAWAYVGLRIVHSLWQSLVNTLKVRFALFVLSTLCLLALAINALRATL
jgi:hypothetical protein